MTDFAPNGQAAPDLDRPHLDHLDQLDLPPPPQLQHGGAFSHQTPFSPGTASNPPRLNHRPSNDFRHASANGSMAGANGNGPMPVPGGPHGRMSNAHLRDMGFGGPRSPPNNKSTSLPFLCIFIILELY